MRIGRHACGRRPLLLFTLLPLLASAQAGYDFDTQPIQPPQARPRGYQPPPRPAQYPAHPIPRFQPHQSVGYQPPPQPALYETQPSRYERPAQHVQPPRPALYETQPPRYERPAQPVQPPRPVYRPQPPPGPQRQPGLVPQQPQQPANPLRPANPPSMAPTGTFGPPPGTEQNAEPVNVIIHVFINDKKPAGGSEAPAPAPSPPAQPLPAELSGIHFPHSAMPLTFTRDFDRDKNRFLLDDEEEQEGPANIVEIKAVVDSSDAAMDMRIGKAMAKELDRAVPVILGKLPDKSSRLNEDLRNQLEQQLIEEISKNLGDHLEQSTDVTEEELSELIEEGVKELENEGPQATAPPPIGTTRPAQPPAPSTSQSTHATQPAQETRTSTQTTQTVPEARPPTHFTEPVPATMPPAHFTQPVPDTRLPTHATQPVPETRPITHVTQPAETAHPAPQTTTPSRLTPPPTITSIGSAPPDIIETTQHFRPATTEESRPAITFEPGPPATQTTQPSSPATFSQPPSPPATQAAAAPAPATRPTVPQTQPPTTPPTTAVPTRSPTTHETVQWWTATTAPSTAATKHPETAQQHETHEEQHEQISTRPTIAATRSNTPTTITPPTTTSTTTAATTTAAPQPTMRTFPTEALPPVTQPTTTKQPAQEGHEVEEMPFHHKGEEFPMEEPKGEVHMVEEMPFHHQGEEFPTEEPAHPMHESTTTNPTTASTARPSTELASTEGTKAPGTTSVTSKVPGTTSEATKTTTHSATERPHATMESVTMKNEPASRPASSIPDITKEESAKEPENTMQSLVPGSAATMKPETTTTASSTETDTKTTEGPTKSLTKIPEGTMEPATKTPEGTMEPTTKTPEVTTKPVEGKIEPTTTIPGTTAEPAKTKSQEVADDLSLDDLIAAIEDGMNIEEMKKEKEEKERKEKEEEEKMRREMEEMKMKIEELKKAKEEEEAKMVIEEMKKQEEKKKEEEEKEEEEEKSKSTEATKSELELELEKALSEEVGTVKSIEATSSELEHELEKELSKEIGESEELVDELSKALEKELDKSEEGELDKVLSKELEKNLEEGKSIEDLIHEGEEAFEDLGLLTTAEPETTMKNEAAGTTEVTKKPVTSPGSHEEMPFEGMHVFEMNATTKGEQKPTTSECPVARNASDTTKADVLFLLDSSTAFNDTMFKGALELMANTTDHFKNIGPDGVQVSLIQFAAEPQLEFSLRRHNCLQTLIEDIKGTEHMEGKTLLGHAIEKATRLAFTRERGDRPEVENILIVVTGGTTEDKVQHPVTVAKENGVDVLVISTIEANPEVVLELAGTADNIFKMDGKITEPLSTRLAQRIRDTASGYRIPAELRFPTFNENKDESGEDKDKEHKPAEAGAITEKTPLKSGEVSQEPLPPPRNLKLSCTRKLLGVNIELPGAFHGWLFIEGQRDKDNCTMKVEKDLEHEYRTVHFEAGIEDCDIAHIQSESPAGINSSAVVSIVKHPKAVSIDDKAYLLECFVASALEATLDAHLEVVGGIKKTIAEAFSLDVVPPKCHYTIRKGSPEGPQVEKADLGEVVYHRWDCDGGDEAYDVFGMHIHDCFASSDIEQQFPIVDMHGCSSNTNLLSQPVYAEGALSVYAESRAFAVENDQQDLKFQCKVSLCTRDGDGCEGLTPPVCSGNATDLKISRRLRHNQAADSALTSAVAASVGLTTSTVSKYSPFVVTVAVILAVFVGLVSAVRLKGCRRHSPRPVVTSPSMEEIYVTVPGRAPIRPDLRANPAMANFMKDFDRSRYV